MVQCTATYLSAGAEGTGLNDVEEGAPGFLKTIEGNESEPASLDQPGCASQRQNLVHMYVCVSGCVDPT